MPPPNHPRIRAASPQRPRIFDPWNSVARGHQVAANVLSGHIGWRESREMKLKAQFEGGLGGSGGERLYDLVGAGAKDDGLQWFMARDRMDKGSTNQRLNTKGEIEAKEAGAEEKEWIKKGKKVSNGKSIKAWDGEVREERICLSAKRKTREEDEEEEHFVSKRVRSSNNVKRKPLQNFDSEKTGTMSEPDTLDARIIAAQDDDDVWEERLSFESSETGGTHHKNSASALKNHRGIKSQGDKSSRTSPDKVESATTTSHDTEAQTARQNTPPSGQTRYSPPPASPVLRKTPITKKNRRHSNIVPPSTTSIIRQKSKPIFAGLTVHISGPTLPLISDHALRGLLVQHGATLALHLARRRITHVVLGRPTSNSSDDGECFTGAGATFAASKLQREMQRIRSATGGPGIRFVSVEWVLESIKADIRLSEARFGIGMDQVEHGNRNEPLSKEEREAIGSEVVATGEKRRMDRRAARFREMGDGKAANNSFQKGIARKSAAMPGQPPGVQSVRSMFLKQHRDNAWTKAGFRIKN